MAGDREIVRRARGALALVLLLGGASLGAQAPRDDARIAGGLLRRIMDDSAKVQCADFTQALRRVCVGLTAARDGARVLDPIKLGEADDQLRRAAFDHDDWAAIWFGFGVLREARARAQIHAKEGPLQASGVSNIAGAGHAFARTLELDSTYAPAFLALARLPVPPEGASQVAKQAEALRRFRLRFELPPEARLAAAQVVAEVAPPDTAVAMYFEALAAGADSGVAYLDLARVLHRAGRYETGRAALFAGATRALTWQASHRYRMELAWVATNDELAEWDSLPRDRRGEWLAAFWRDRDARDGLKEGERLVEHYKRVEYALANFRLMEPLPGHGGRHRGRSIGMVGDRLGEGIGDPSKGIDPTISRFENIRRDPSAWATDGPLAKMELPPPRTVGLAPKVEASDRFDATLGPKAVVGPYPSGDLLLDDRGLVWIRHGRPDVVHQTAGGAPYEAWQYRRGRATPLVLFFGEADFDGIGGASVLIPTIAGADGEALDQLCGSLDGTCDQFQVGGAIGSKYTGGAARDGSLATGRRSPPEAIVKDRERGRAMTLEAIGSDGAPRAFERVMSPVVQLYGLRHQADGTSRLLAVFSIPGAQLRPDSVDAQGRTIYEVQFRVVLTDRLTGEHLDGEGTRRLVRTGPLGPEEFFSGTIDVTMPGGTQRVLLRLTQRDGGGADARAAAVRVPAGTGALEVSDLVLGKEGSGVRWNSGATMVPLNPLNAFRKSEQAELYYQIMGQQAGKTYETKVDVFEADPAATTSRLSLAFRDVATGPGSEVQRTLGLRNLDPGSYRLRVTVKGPNGEATETTRLVIVK